MTTPNKSPQERLAGWLKSNRLGNDGTFGALAVGMTFPLRKGETLMVHKPFRATRYQKRGALLHYAGLSAYATIFRDAQENFVTVQHNQLQNLLP